MTPHEELQYHPAVVEAQRPLIACITEACLCHATNPEANQRLEELFDMAQSALRTAEAVVKASSHGQCPEIRYRFGWMYHATTLLLSADLFPIELVHQDLISTVRVLLGAAEKIPLALELNEVGTILKKANREPSDPSTRH